ncbi:MAG TPA: TIGR02996 domain-containing protein, partial [Gemmata sp.]
MDDTPARQPRADLLALIRAAKEQPDEDTIRLVIADWLDEHGDAGDRANAALIRLQCELARLSDYDPRGTELRKQEEALQEQSPWSLGDDPRLWRACSPRGWKRGLAKVEAQPARALLDVEAALTASEGYAWVDELLAVQLGADQVPRLARSPLLEGLNKLSLFSLPIDVDGARAIASSPRLGLLRELELSHNELGPIGAYAFAERLNLPRLQTLRITSNGFNAETAEAFAAEPAISRIAVLGLGNNALGEKGISALAASPHLPGLTALELDMTDLDDAAVVALARLPRFASLTKLTLQHNNLGATGARALTGATSLTELDLWRNPLYDDGAAALVANSGLSRLKRLQIGNTRLGEAGARAL